MRSTPRIAFIACGLAVLAASGWWLLGQDAADETPRVAAPAVVRAEAPSTPAVEAPGVADVPAAPVNAEVAADPAPDVPVLLAVLTGRITRAADGSPVAGVAVKPWVWEAEQNSAVPPDGTPQSTTDADGRYRFAYPRPCRVVKLIVGCGPDTTQGVAKEELPLVPGKTATLDMQVGAGAVLSGLVVDTAGRPIVGARVLGWSTGPDELRSNYREADRTTESDGAGAFAVHGLGPDFLLIATAKDYVPLRNLHGTLSEGERLGLGAGGAPLDPPLTLVLSPAREIRGRVVGPDGQPVARTRLQATPIDDPLLTHVTAAADVFVQEPWALEAHCRKDGSFVFTTAPDVPCDILVSAPEHAGWRGVHAPGDPDLLIRLGAGAILAGRVVAAADGAPVPGAELYLIAPTAGSGAWTGNTFADETGHFAFTGLPPSERAELQIVAENFALEVQRPVAIPEASHSELTIALNPARVLAGVVRDAAGAPIEGAKVRIEGDRIVDMGGNIIYPVPTWESRAGLDETTTDATGAFRFDKLYDGRFEVTARHPESDELRASVQTVSGSEDLVLVLDSSAAQGVTFVGRATDASTGRPVTSFNVAATTPQKQGGRAGRSYPIADPDGAWRISGVTPGEIVLRASAPGYADWSLPLQIPAPSEQRVDILFVPTRQVRFRIVDIERRPVEASISFRDESGDSLPVNKSPTQTDFSVSTDERGEVLVRDLPADRIVAKVRAFGPDRTQDYALDLRPEPVGVIELQIGGPTTLRLVVTVLGAHPDIEMPAEGQQLAWRTALEPRLSLGALWAVDGNVHVRVLDADGDELAQSWLDAAATGPYLDLTRKMLPLATRPVMAELEAPIAAATVVVEADGYVTSTLAVPAPPPTGERAQLLVLLRRE